MELVVYIDEENLCLYQVMKWKEEKYKVYKFELSNKKWKPIKNLNWKTSYKKAQKDLEKLAKKNKWKKGDVTWEFCNHENREERVNEEYVGDSD